MSRRENAKELRATLDAILRLPVPDSKLIEYGFDPDQPGVRGTTYAQVVALRLVENSCNGDNSSIRDLLDRLYGKPVQTSENINANLSYYDYLRSIAEAEGMVKPDKQVIVIPEDIPLAAPPRRARPEKPKLVTSSRPRKERSEPTEDSLEEDFREFL